MTDLQKFIELYKSVGIDLVPTTYNHHQCLTLSTGETKINNASKTVGGYHGFETRILFDKDGKFLTQEIYE